MSKNHSKYHLHVAFLVFILAWGLSAINVAQGQSYPLNDPPVTNSVPQYVPGASGLRNATPEVNSLPRTNLPSPKQLRKPPARNQPVRQSSPSSNRTAPKKKSKVGSFESILEKAREQANGGKKDDDKKSKDAKKEKKLPPHYGIDFSIYRDCSPTPIDPRKPCNKCIRPDGLPRGKFVFPGESGRPYQDSEPGGCQCDSKKPNKRPSYSVYWPRPLSSKIDEKHPNKAALRYCDVQRKRIMDVFDPLSKIKLSKYQRSDNGYSGVGSDPYGCLGESKHIQHAAMFESEMQVIQNPVYNQWDMQPSPGFDHPVNDPNLPLESSGYQEYMRMNGMQPGQPSSPGFNHPVNDPALPIDNSGYQNYLRLNGMQPRQPVSPGFNHPVDDPGLQLEAFGYEK